MKSLYMLSDSLIDVCKKLQNMSCISDNIKNVPIIYKRTTKYDKYFQSSSCLW